MPEEVQTPSFYLILSGVIAVLTCGSLIGVYGFIRVLTFHSSNFKEHIDILDCRRYEVKKEIYQYNNYWVMAHVVRAEGIFRRNVCIARYALLIQGLPHEIYSSGIFVNRCTNKTFQVDFAVYLATPNDLYDAITAIRYMHQCDGQNSQIPKRVNYHFYFHTEILAEMPIPTNIEILIRVPINCTDHPQFKANSSNIMTAERMAEIKTVGQNILRQVSYANLHVPFDQRTLFDAKICTEFIDEVLRYVATNNLKSFNSQNIIFRRPTLVVPQFEVFQKYLNGSIGNYLPYDSWKWCSVNNTNGFRKTKKIFDELVGHISFFILFWHAPLLDDRAGLTPQQRQNLFLLRLTYENYAMIMLHSSSVIYRPTTEDLQTNTSLKSQNQFESLDKQILEEYIILLK